MTTVLGNSHGQLSMSGALPRPLERRSFPSLSTIALRLYSILKYHLRWRGGCASGSPAFLRSLQLFRLANKACTHASDVCACSFAEVYHRIRCLGPSQIPLCRTVRQKETTTCE